jgi:hypothetical protein
LAWRRWPPSTRPGGGEGVNQPARRGVEVRLKPGCRLRFVAGHAGLHRGGDDLLPGLLMIQDVADGRLGRQRAVGRRRVGRLPGVGAVSHAYRLGLPGDVHRGGGPDRDDDLQPEAALRPFPGDLGVAVGRAMTRRGRGQAPGRCRPDQQLAIAGSGRCQARHRAMQPVGHRTEGVVVERRHLARVDGAVGQHAVPAFPGGGGAHCHRVQPGRAAGLEQQPVGHVQVAGVRQGVGDQRGPDEPGADPEAG